MELIKWNLKRELLFPKIFQEKLRAFFHEKLRNFFQVFFPGNKDIFIGFLLEKSGSFFYVFFLKKSKKNF